MPTNVRVVAAGKVEGEHRLEWQTYLRFRGIDDEHPGNRPAMSLPPHARSPAPQDSEHPRPDSRRYGAGREARIGMLPSLVVALTLACLLAVPALFQRQIDANWEEIAYVAEPARAMLLDTKRALAREMAAMRAYVLTEDPRYLATYQ